MYNNIPEILRKQSIESLFKANTFNNSWSIWRTKVNQILGSRYDDNKLINLGDSLSEIFQTTGNKTRSQSSLSGGGVAWESLVCWYINLCCVGSRIVAIKKMSLVPKPIQQSITVNYGNFACNTESDITIIVFPNLSEYKDDVNKLTLNDNLGNPIPVSIRGNYNPKISDVLIEKDFHLTEVGIIQCKTNWNDNAQIPMLWDMIYSAGGFRGRNITIGRNNYSIINLKQFTYSFVTVPSNNRGVYNQKSVSVKRVTNLSGGNYWGKPTIPGVAKSIKEIFGSNYVYGFDVNIRRSLKNNLSEFLPNKSLSYFNL
jgi:hypothetical protein